MAAAGLDRTTTLVTTSGAWQLDLPPGTTVDTEEAAAVDAATTVEPGVAFGLASAAAATASRVFLPGPSGAWVGRRQAVLRELRRRAFETLAATAVVLGDWGRGNCGSRGAVGLEPFRSRPTCRSRRLTPAPATGGTPRPPRTLLF